MAQPTPDQNLHLPSLVIKNFRGIDELTIPRLGRVTLLTGKNGVGKTTVLDAVRIYATRANGHIILETLHNRGDVMVQLSEPGHERVVPDIGALFNNRSGTRRNILSIGPEQEINVLQIRSAAQRQTPRERRTSSISDVSETMRIEARLGRENFTLVYPYPLDFDPGSKVCNTLGPDLSSDATIEHYWNQVALSPNEDWAVDALNLMTDTLIERVAIIDTGTRKQETFRRRLMAKVGGQTNPVPLRSLGDGAVRAFTIALGITNSQDGFLLIDEAENGIHHSIQAKFWNMVLQTAERNNVQVIATTHSWDCVVGFAKAANELDDVEGVLYRIQRSGERLRAVEYPETELANAAKHRIEVR